MGMGFEPPAYKGIVQDERGWWAVIYSGRTKVVKGPFATEDEALIASVAPKRRRQLGALRPGEGRVDQGAYSARPPE